MTEAAGSFRNGIHVLPVRVYYEDTDAGGIVYYANYLRFAERARSEWLRHLGIESSRMMKEQKVAFAVKWCAMDFVKPAKLDDLLAVETRVLAIGGASLTLEQTVRLDGADLVRMELKLACMSLDGGAARLPTEIRKRLEEART